MKTDKMFLTVLVIVLIIVLCVVVYKSMSRSSCSHNEGFSHNSALGQIKDLKFGKMTVTTAGGYGSSSTSGFFAFTWGAPSTGSDPKQGYNLTYDVAVTDPTGKANYTAKAQKSGFAPIEGTLIPGDYKISVTPNNSFGAGPAKTGTGSVPSPVSIKSITVSLTNPDYEGDLGIVCDVTNPGCVAYTDYSLTTSAYSGSDTTNYMLFTNPNTKQPVPIKDLPATGTGCTNDILTFKGVTSSPMLWQTAKGPVTRDQGFSVTATLKDKTGKVIDTMTQKWTKAGDKPGTIQSINFSDAPTSTPQPYNVSGVSVSNYTGCQFAGKAASLSACQGVIQSGNTAGGFSGTAAACGSTDKWQAKSFSQGSDGSCMAYKDYVPSSNLTPDSTGKSGIGYFF